ncbi:MAG: hypothetical protein GYA57_14205 [Myxococcales bacterium]|nr:hypothetical protein [Myxococcales bacterium]
MSPQRTLPLLALALLLVPGCRKETPPSDAGGPEDVAAVPPPDAGSASPAPGEPDAAAGGGPAAVSGPDGGRAAGEPFRVVFFPVSRAQSFVGSFLLPDSRPVDAVWTPTRDDLDRLLAGLPARLEADRDRRGKEIAGSLRRVLSGDRPDAAWDRYGVQVVGVVSGQRRLVYANFYCNPSNFLDRDEEHLVMVLDGGTCFFQVWFDPETGEYPRVRINGAG